MEEITRNNFTFFQNEILKDIKTIEKKLNEKIISISKNFQNTALIIEQKYEDAKIRVEEIKKRIESEDIIEQINDKINKVNSKLEETALINSTKISSLEKDLSNACYKYDKIFINNISIPGLIGDGCPYSTMKSFLEFVNTKLRELISTKERSSVDFKRYEEWVKSTLNKFQEEITDNKNSIYNYLAKEIKQYDKRSFDKMNIVEDKLSFIKIENGQYNYNLSKKWEELDEKLKLFYTMNDNLINTYNNSRKEFIQIKKRFNDLSDYFKDIKYTKSNISTKSIFDELSKKIKMNKLQIKSNDESSKNSNVLPSIEDISQIKSNNKIDRGVFQNFYYNIEKKKSHTRLLKKKTFQLENNFGSSFNLKKNFYNNNYLNNASNLNLMTETNNNNFNNLSGVKPQLTFERKRTEILRTTDFKSNNDKNTIKEKTEPDSLVLKENKESKDNNINIDNIEEQNKENSTMNKNSIEINDKNNNEDIKEEEKDNSENNSKGNNEINQDLDLHSSVSKNNIANIEHKRNIIKQTDNINISNNNIKLLYDNNNNFNNLNINRKINNIDEELNKFNLKFDNIYDKLKNKVMEMTYQLNNLISRLNKIIFRKEDKINKIREIDIYLERKKKNIFLNNSGLCLPFSNNSTDENLKSIKKEKYDKDNSFNVLANKNSRNKDIYNSKLYFNNIKLNKNTTKQNDSRSNSNNGNINNNTDKNKNNFYIRMIDPLSLSKIESYLIKKFTEPN